MAPRFKLLPATLDPPAISTDDFATVGEEEDIPWALLEVEAYVANRENATTAHSKTWDGKDIQVTFFLRRPPHLSYACVFSAEANIPVEPQVLATEDDLVLLRIIVSSSEDDVMNNIDYYVYQADNGSGQPSLHLLPRPSCRLGFDAQDIGILRCHTKSRFFLHPHSSDEKNDDKFYIVAGLACDDQQKDFVLHILDSKNIWITSPVELNHQQKRELGAEFLHFNSKVFAIGGDAGTMAFVDLWRGILLCDVLPAAQGKALPPLHYVPLPSCKSSWADARHFRDIALIQGCIKFAELQFHIKKSRVLKGHRLTDGWIAATWSRAASDFSVDAWNKDSEIDSNHINLEGNPYLELLPKVINDEDVPLPPFKRLDICRPTLSLQDDESRMYIMAKINRADNVAWVVALDLKDKTVVDVSEFAAERTTCITLTYIHSRISKHLKKDRGTLGNLEGAGTALQESSGKKHPEMEGGCILAEDGDMMVLDPVS